VGSSCAAKHGRAKADLSGRILKKPSPKREAPKTEPSKITQQINNVPSVPIARNRLDKIRKILGI
jgi:hypothetical protein